MLQEALLYFTMNKEENSKSNTIINYFNCKPDDYPMPTITCHELNKNCVLELPIKPDKKDKTFFTIRDWE